MPLRPVRATHGPFFMRAAVAATAMHLFACTAIVRQEPEQRMIVVEIVDASDSALTDRCAEVAADLQVLLAQPNRRDLDLMVLAVGNSKTGYEPVPLIAERFRASATAFEEPGADERHRHDWIAKVVSDCDARLVPADRSPVFLAVKRGIQAVEELCARVVQEGGACTERRLYIHSDLRDNVEPGVRARLYPRAKRAKRGTPAPLPRLDTRGVRILACGLSETRTAGDDHVGHDAVLSVWREVVANDLHVSPGCARLPREEGDGAGSP